MIPGHDTLGTKKSLNVNGKDYAYYSLATASEKIGDISRLPFSLKVLLENLLRFEDGKSVTTEDIEAFSQWAQSGQAKREIAYRPARVLMQDFTGVPAVVDLAAMRDAMKSLGEDPEKINPLAPVDLVIDHSVMVDYFGGPDAFKKNVDREYERNGERYKFLKWGQGAFDNFRVVPPGTGICHQVNLEYLAQTVWTSDASGEKFAYPDTLVGTDSHTTMINGLSVLGWGVGGIEAEAAMLGQPISMLIPEVIGFRMTDKLPEGATATDLVLVVVEMLRKKGVVGKFVEFYGPGLDHLSLEDQATIANMAPEYGATCGFFPVDNETLRYLKATGRSDERIALVEAYSKVQGMWRDKDTPDPIFTDTLELDLSSVLPSISGPKRPQDRINLADAAAQFKNDVKTIKGGAVSEDKALETVGEARFEAEGANMENTQAADYGVPSFAVTGSDYGIHDGSVVIAAITSCTNTSNPSVLIAAGLVAKNAREKGLSVKPWVKTSLAPGSQVVTDYLDAAGLTDDLDALGFNLVGYGCTTCIGNSGPLPGPISRAVNENDLVACSVLSGNRNFEGRISQDVRANYLASPPLVVAYALAGSMHVDLTKDPLGKDADGNDVFLKDLWPTNHEIAEVVREHVTAKMFADRYADVFKGDDAWRSIDVSDDETYQWPSSTYVANPPYFEGMTLTPEPVSPIEDARVLALFGDSITTDHISPAGAIKEDGPAGDYLKSHQVSPREFNSFGSRRGNHEVMMRGTFANIRIKNEMLPGTEGGVTKFAPSGETMPIYDAAMKYKESGTPLIVFAGEQYGTGSSRDWAAKGTILLGVRAVVAKSFERIHRSNLIGMGVLPLQFADGVGWDALGMTGDEQVSIEGIDSIEPRQKVKASIKFANGDVKTLDLLVRIDTGDELDYYRHGGILHYVIRKLAA
ncbi:MAG: aconitate hydratase AcnA [Marinicaulis sp.]|nr:aconitate hydratase AcnA [Marinicaulis sp.]